ncbi:LuxR family maltose regulon positive regulatory protein [Leifsonia sp. 563]|uniref:helix-turn-helix transcriptional regulator n=1 Tax=Leifsonia sp. 563 TaxID=3156412 RepID=UPI00339724BF
MSTFSDESAHSFSAGADPEPASDDDIRLTIDRDVLRLFQNAVDAGDYDAATAVVRDHWFDVVIGIRLGFAQVAERIPAAELHTRPLLMMMLGIAYNLQPNRRMKGLRYFVGAARAARQGVDRVGPVDRALILASESAAYRLIGRPRLGITPARKAVAALDGLTLDQRAAVQALSRIYAHVGTTQYYAGQVESALETFEKGMAESPPTGYSSGFANIAMAAGIHALRGDIHEAMAFIELAQDEQWTAQQRSWYPGTFYRVAEAIVALERFDAAEAREQLAAMTHDRRTIEHWRAIAATEALADLVAGRPSAGLAGIDAFAALRGAEGRGAAARRELAPYRALLHIALGDLAAASAVLRQLESGSVHRHVGLARVELAFGRTGAALQQVRRVAGAPMDARTHAEVLALEAAALLRFASGPRRTAAVDELGELLRATGQRLAVALVPVDDFPAVRDALDGAGFGDVLAGVPARSLLLPLPEGEALSKRELAVLEVYLRIPRVPQVAEELGVSVNTVKSQIRSIYRKLDVSNRDEAIAVALDRHLVRLPD